jgi:hypothetical protein
MPVGNCPDWDYASHPDVGNLLPQRCHALLVWLRAKPRDSAKLCSDTRRSHAKMFTGLTPDSCPYMAGHYRGENFRCLKYLNVQIPADPRVGAPYDVVDGATRHLAFIITDGIGILDGAWPVPDAQLSRSQKIHYVVTFACRVFVDFLTVHPYANGNGHIARFIIWGVLGHYQIWPRRWPVNDRPPDPPYSGLITLYRNGQHDPLEQFVLKCILGTP